MASLDLIATARLDFCAPDHQHFPCLNLARQAAEVGGTAPTLLNAANEAAVAAFLARRLSFNQIPQVIEQVLERLPVDEPDALEVVQSADLAARTLAQRLIDAL